MSSRASVSARASVVRQAGPFSAKPLETQLGPSAFLALENLKKSDTAAANGSLQKSLARAAELIQNLASTLNDRAAEERTRRQTKLTRLSRDGEEESEDARAQHENFQKQVEDLTKKMDESIRRVADNQHWAEELPNSIKHVIDNTKDSQRRAQRPQLDEDSEEALVQEDSAQTSAQPNAHETPTALLHAAQSTADTEWDSKTLTERYSQHPTYAAFYEMLWDAKNPGEAKPPLPHHSLWFAAQEGRNNTSNQRNRGTQPGTQQSTQNQNISLPNDNSNSNMADLDLEDEDTDLQISSHTRSTKCPLTLRYFLEPVTSTKCPHSFEKSAILDFIRQASDRTPLTPDQLAELDTRVSRSSKSRPGAEASMRSRNPKHARCPEGGCTVYLTETDLRPDPVLARLVKRAKEADKHAAEESDSEDELGGEDSDDDVGLPTGTQRRRRRVVPIDSSPTGVSTGGTRLTTLGKSEREVSVVPNSQVQGMPSGSRVGGRRRVVDVMDLDDDEHDDE